MKNVKIPPLNRGGFQKKFSASLNFCENNPIVKWKEVNQMRFTVINGYYSFGKVTPCKMLAVFEKDEDGDFEYNGVEFGDIRDGVFYVGEGRIGEQWIIDELPDLLCCTRDPRPGEIHLSVTPRCSERTFEKYKPYKGLLGELRFSLEGKNVFLKGCRAESSLLIATLEVSK